MPLPTAPLIFVGLTVGSSQDTLVHELKQVFFFKIEGHQYNRVVD